MDREERGKTKRFGCCKTDFHATVGLFQCNEKVYILCFVEITAEYRPFVIQPTGCTGKGCNGIFGFHLVKESFFYNAVFG